MLSRPTEPIPMDVPDPRPRLAPAPPSPWRRIYQSSKARLALIAIVQTIGSHYLGIPPEVWASVDVLILAVIGGNVVEDAAYKFHPPPPPPYPPQEP